MKELEGMGVLWGEALFKLYRRSEILNFEFKKINWSQKIF